MKLDFDIIALLIRTIISDLTPPHFIANIFLIPSFFVKDEMNLRTTRKYYRSLGSWSFAAWDYVKKLICYILPNTNLKN